MFGGLKNLRLSGGIENNSFEIGNPLDATLANVSASGIPVDLKINLLINTSESCKP